MPTMDNSWYTEREDNTSLTTVSLTGGTHTYFHAPVPLPYRQTGAQYRRRYCDEYECIVKKKEKQRHKRRTRSSSLKRTQLQNHSYIPDPTDSESAFLSHVDLKKKPSYGSTVSGMQTKTVTAGVSANPDHFQTSLANQSTASHVSSSQSHDTNVTSVTASETEQQTAPELTNTKEISPTLLIIKLAQFNKITYRYALVYEQCPDGTKQFYVKIELGDDPLYSASGPSIKKAVHAAAVAALEKTAYKHPPPNVHVDESNKSMSSEDIFDTSFDVTLNSSQDVMNNSVDVVLNSSLEQPSSQKVKDAVPESADEDDLKKLHSPKKKKRKRSKLQDDSLTDEQPSSSNSRLNDHVPNASQGVKQLSNSGAPNSGSETVKSKTRSSHKTTITDDRHREATADSGNTIKSTSKKKRRCEADGVPKITRISGLEQPSSQKVKDAVPESADEDNLKKLHSPKKKKRKRSKLQDDSLTDEQPSSSNSRLNDHVPNASRGVKQFSNSGAPNSGSETVKSKTRSSHKTTLTDDRHREATTDSGNTIKSTSKKKRRCEADSVPKITRISGLEQPSSQKLKDAVPESADEDDLKKLHSPKKKERKRSKLQDNSLTDEQPSSSNSKLNDHVPTASRGVKQLSNSGAPNSGSETLKSKTRSSHKTTLTDDRHREATTDSGNTIKSTSKKKRRCAADGVPKITRISGNKSMSSEDIFDTSFDVTLNSSQDVMTNSVDVVLNSSQDVMNNSVDVVLNSSLEQPSSQNVKDAVSESADEDDLKKLHSPKKKKRKRSKLQDDSLTYEQPSSSKNSRLNDHVPNASRGVKQFSNSGAPNCGSETVKSKTRSSHKTTLTDDRHREATTDPGNTIKSTSKNKRSCKADGVPKITRISGLEQPSSQNVKDAVSESADEDDLKKLHSPKKKKRKRSKLQDDSLTDEQPSSSKNSRLNDHVPNASQGVKQLSNSGASNSGSETVKSKTMSSHKTTITDDRHREATTDSGNTIKSTSKKKRSCKANGVRKITRISGDICEELHGCNKVGWHLSKRMKESMKERGTPVRTGTWLPEEDQFLHENIACFHEANPSVDVHELLFGDDAGDVKKRLSLIKETEFYKNMCVGLMRTNYDCYRRVRQVLYANYKVAGAFSADDEKRLRVLYNRYGSNWHKIAEKLGRTYQSVFAKWNNMQKENDGKWSTSENDHLIEAVQSYIQDKKGDANKAEDRMPWMELCKSVPGRSAKQCRQHWMLQLRTEFLTGTFSEMWKKKDRCALIKEIIEQNVENESDIDFDQICRNFEGRGRIVSNYFVRRRWRVMKQSVNGHSVQSFPDILDTLAEFLTGTFAEMWKKKDRCALIEEIIEQNVENESDIDFDQICRNFEGRGRIVSNYFVRRRWHVMKQSVNGHSVQSFPDILDTLAEEFHT